uniref:Uncharacterized protein n=1 Tax=Anguilla anguilla TaxID=7936 RepID=A0A0E9PUZ6_ANGAN
MPFTCYHLWTTSCFPQSRRMYLAVNSANRTCSLR